MNRIKSYTVIEMLIVMLISTLSIGIAYTCYTIFSKQHLGYKNNSEELASYSLMDKLLTKDVSTCIKAKKTLEGFDCIFRSKTIHYEFYDEYLLRRDLVIDTFKITFIQMPEYQLLGSSQNFSGHLLDELMFAVAHKEVVLNFHYKKLYGADVLMSMEDSSDK